MEISFYGAARTVTGSKFVVKSTNRKILLDCGLYQGLGNQTNKMNREFEFDPTEVDYLFLSHAHIDHSGNIPTLVKMGFKGKIICTQATKELCEIMLADSAYIQENDVKFINKIRARKGQPEVEPLYTHEDYEDAMKLFESYDYDIEYELDKYIKFSFTNTGHILGSAAINLRVSDSGITKKICFTGDIGREKPMILKAPDKFPQADIIITESTYGDRLHDDEENSKEQLLKIIQETCVEKRGKLIIPAFSVGRTQELVFIIDSLESEGRLPHIEVFVDSPLSTNATDIVRRNKHLFNDNLKEYMKTDDDPFGFNRLHYIREAKQSKLLNTFDDPCIIISASGMMEAGRIMHHLANNISNPRNTVLIVGYCAENTLGRKLIDGAKKVNIFGDEYAVKANIEIVNSYSAHGDYKEMMNYLDCQNPALVENLFLVHGEYEVMLDYRERLHGKGFSKITIPDKGHTHSLI